LDTIISVKLKKYDIIWEIDEFLGFKMQFSLPCGNTYILYR